MFVVGIVGSASNMEAEAINAGDSSEGRKNKLAKSVTRIEEHVLLVMLNPKDLIVCPSHLHKLIETIE